MSNIKAFQRLPQREERYRQLVEAITDYAIYMLDSDGTVVSWNEGARRFKGYEAGEIIGEHFSRFYTDQDRAQGLPARALAQAREQGSFQSEGWRVRKDGTHFWASVVIDPIRGKSGQIEGFAKITRDLTERREAERVLRQSQEQFRLLVQGVTDYAIYMLDPTGKVASWNLGAQRIKQYLPQEIIGQHFSRFYTETDRANGEPQRALERAMREGRFEKEGTRVRKDGSTFIAHVVIDAVHDDSGQLIGFAKITRDITERRQAQDTLEKTREALFQSQKMESIGQLTGGVAHDFNNLLMAIMGSLSLLEKKLPDDPQMKRLLNNALQGASRGATLTQRMLAFARRQPLNPQPVAVSTLIQGMADLLQSSIGAAAQVETRLSAGLPPAMADANQLELAILNLATNARDAMPGGGKIIIAANAESLAPGNDIGLAAGRYICVSVIDHGEGMDEETLSHAAEPFFTTKGIGKGTGLGLPMVHGMTEQMGGRLKLKSRKGEGTTAQIYLPVADASAAVDAASQVAATATGKRLLVVAVDDDALVLLNTTAMLEDMGHTVLEASSADQALELVRSNPVDLVITDQAMPKITGMQLLTAIGAERPGLPVIIATGYAELPPGSPTGLPILNKPFTETDLARVVARTIAAQ